MSTFPVPSNYGERQTNIHRQRVIDDSGTFYPNSTPNTLDTLKRNGLPPPLLYMGCTAVSSSKLYSCYPTSSVGDLTVARAGTKTRINENGYIQQIAANIASIDYTTGVPVLLTEPATTNLITYSEAFGNSYYTKSGATIEGDASTAGSELIASQTDRDFSGANNWVNVDMATFDNTGDLTITSNAGNQGCRLPEVNAPMNLNTQYILTVTASGLSGDGFTIRDFDNTVLNNTILVDGVNTLQFNYNNAAGDPQGGFRIRSEGTGGITLDDFSLKQVSGFSSPKVDSSGDFELTAYKFVEDAGGTLHYTVGDLVSTGTVNNYTVTIYAKAAERSWIWLRLTGGAAGGNGVYFDLTNGVVGTETGATGTITEITNGWYKCIITCIPTWTNNTVRIYLADGDNSNSYSGNGTSGIYIYGAQLTETSYPVSYIPTSGATVTTVADVVTGAGDATLFSSVNSSGVLYAEIAALADDGGNRIISLSDGTTNHRIHLFYTLVSNQIRGNLYDNPTVAADLTYVVPNETDFIKVAFRYSVNDFSLWVNGTEQSTDVSGATFPAGTLTELSFNDGGSSSPFYGKTKQVAVYNYLSDTEMANLTTP